MRWRWSHFETALLAAGPIKTAVAPPTQVSRAVFQVFALLHAELNAYVLVDFLSVLRSIVARQQRQIRTPARLPRSYQQYTFKRRSSAAELKQSCFCAFKKLKEDQSVA